MRLLAPLHRPRVRGRLATSRPIRVPIPQKRPAIRRDAPRSTALCALALAFALLHALDPAPAAAQHPSPFTIEDVLSSPFPSGLVASPAGDRVAWVRNDRGVRNVWAASAPDWRARRLTGYSEDVGQELENLRFTPDGDRLLYGVGGAPNRFGEHANPTSLPRGPELALYVVDVQTGERRSIPGGSSRALAPDGGRYLITRGDDVLIRPLAGDSAPRPLFTVRRGASDLTWSPDGTRVAFVSRRGDHAFVGVYDLEADEIRWMAPSVDHDVDPVWSPAGDRLAFLRIPNRRDELPFFAAPEALPWSIMVADPATGEGVEVWRADEGPGSAFYGVDGPALIWAGERLIFPWEKNGWLQMWSLPLDADGWRAAGQAVALTPAGAEVQWLALGPDSTELFISSNHGDIDRRHIWRVAVDGSSPPSPVTSGTGLEWDPVPLAGDVVAFLASGPTTPAHAEILVNGQRRTLIEDPVPERFPTEHLVAPRAVIFAAADGLSIHGQLFAPPARCGNGPHPGLLFFHGGSRRQMLLGFHDRGYYHNAYAFHQYMANRCYAVLAVNYRSGIGYGLAFREAEDYGAGGASEFNDVVGAGRWLAALPNVDPDRIALWGGSYGGYLTALGLARAPELFAAGVDLHGVHDWNVGIANFVDYDRTARPDVAALALRSSPMHDLSRWEDPVLLIHGDDDRNVRFSETVDLAEALRVRDVEVETLVFPDEVHGFLLWESWVRAYTAADAFLERHLGR